MGIREPWDTAHSYIQDVTKFCQREYVPFYFYLNMRLIS